MTGHSGSFIPSDCIEDVRLTALDGLRGWAALSVMLFHFIWETFGAIAPGFRNLVIGSLLNGTLSVEIFFILSGEALSTAYWRTQDRRVALRMMAKRYPRLTIPVFACCLIVFLLMSFNLAPVAAAAAIVDRKDWLGSFLTFTPNIKSLLNYAFHDVYYYRKDASTYDPFLWSISWELAGSFLVACVLFVERLFKPGWFFVAALLAMVMAHSQISFFLAGVMFARMRQMGIFARLRQAGLLGRWRPPAEAALIAVLMLYAGWVQWTGRPHPILMSIALVFLLHVNKGANRFLRSPVSQYLGRISFPLYLVHFPVLVSFTAATVVFAAAHGGLNPLRIAGICLASAAMSLGAATLFLPIEFLAIYVSRLFGNLVPNRATAADERSVSTLIENNAAAEAPVR